ncbi:15-hydroxyprostaglandin dehydrogenase [NAD(+)] isoform X5 [Larimichthys crocea]|uniref:15-hydroxyprostaglandin dehydrogenase [NAD(+)] isoform X5 n=1 Tax=Larimichthys crocea TaxID=215358 RepID=UPI000F5E3409|nr:15-hydroxyprostaglandin dehydrogenase [NAD(+)] isoform X5 [Larimichthys crocea]
MALNGKIAVVTGAAIGIGKAMTEKLLQNGAKVTLIDVNETAGKNLMETLQKEYGQDKTLFMKCDVESEEQIKDAFHKTIETFGGIDILCNNAGILDESQWEKTVSINLVGVIRVAYLALEQMSKLSGGRGGVIINTASLAGLGPLPSCPVYTATKHGVIGFTEPWGLPQPSQAMVYESTQFVQDSSKLTNFPAYHPNWGNSPTWLIQTNN